MKRHISTDRFAAWIWFGNDEGPLQRLLDSAERKAAELGLMLDAEPYSKNREDLPSGFNEKSHCAWIHSVADDQDCERLRRLITTMRISLGQESPSRYEVDDDFTFIDPAGDGFKGNVFRARQRSLNRLVGVKIIKPEWGGDALRHAQTMSRLSGHPNVVEVHLITKLRSPVDSRLCNAMVMEWLEGVRLCDLHSIERLEVVDAKRLCYGLLNGLRHIHDSGIAHSDLHEGNVMILDDLKLKIIDADEDRQASFKQLDPSSIAKAKQRDVDNCITNILAICKRSKLPFDQFMDTDLRQAVDLDEIKESLRHIFSAENPFRIGRQSPKQLLWMYLQSLPKDKPIPSLTRVSRFLDFDPHLLNNLFGSLKRDGYLEARDKGELWLTGRKPR